LCKNRFVTAFKEKKNVVYSEYHEKYANALWLQISTFIRQQAYIWGHWELISLKEREGKEGREGREGRENHVPVYLMTLPIAGSTENGISE
jgi:hypothetical protein